jgi:gluconolactonase
MIKHLPTVCFLFIASFKLAAQTPNLTKPEVEKFASGFNFVEGPLWIENEGLIFSDIPENKVFLLNTDSVVSTYLSPSGKSNGLALDKEGNLILCQHLARQVGKYINDTIVPLATHYNGTRLNSPNDLTVKSTGSIFFTDPPFGLNDEGGTSELGFAGIYSVTSDGKVHLLDNSLTLPNGIAFSPDETKLYVIESQVADIYVWDVVNDSTLANKTLFYNMNTQWGDGMKTDESGFLYVTAANGVTIFSAQGELIENIRIGSSNSSNCAWGSLNGEPTMYVTAGNSVYRLRNKEVNTGFQIEPKLPIDDQIIIYPNPSRGDVTITLNNDGKKDANVYVYSATGKLLKTLYQHTNGFEKQIGCKIENSGLYFLVVQSEGNISAAKFIIQN